MHAYSYERISRSRFLTTHILLDSLWRRRGAHCKNFIHDPVRVGKYLSKTLVAALAPRGRMSIAIATYTWLRCVDDVFDDDAPAPWGLERENYLKAKQLVIDAIANREQLVLHHEDKLLMFAIREAKKYGVDIRRELIGIWDSMVWVENARKNGLKLSKEEIVRYTDLDDQNVVSLCVKVFGGNVDVFSHIAPVIQGVFMRIDTLYDMDDDLRKGIVRIPEDVFHSYGIDRNLVCRATSWSELLAVSGFSNWYQDELKDLEQHLKTVKHAFRENLHALFPSKIVAYLFDRKVLVGADRMIEEARLRMK